MFFVTIDEYAKAIAAEQEAWEAVKDRLPGSPGYSKELWELWRDAAQRANAMRRQVLDLTPPKSPP
jgi:hypothetical protein